MNGRVSCWYRCMVKSVPPPRGRVGCGRRGTAPTQCPAPASAPLPAFVQSAVASRGIVGKSSHECERVSAWCDEASPQQGSPQLWRHRSARQGSSSSRRAGLPLPHTARRRLWRQETGEESRKRTCTTSMPSTMADTEPAGSSGSSGPMMISAAASGGTTWRHEEQLHFECRLEVNLRALYSSAGSSGLIPIVAAASDGTTWGNRKPHRKTSQNLKTGCFGDGLVVPSDDLRRRQRRHHLETL